jgi:two-component system NtrC family sensor kinase
VDEVGGADHPIDGAGNETRDATQGHHGDLRVIDTLPNPAIVTDAEGLVIAWNKAAERTYGISREAAIDRPLELLLGRSRADEPRLQAELIQAQKMEAIGQLVSGVAHELNNPLAAIVAFSQLIVRDPRLPDDLKHDAALLIQESDRTRRIVQNLLDFARQRPPERHPTPIRALVQSILDLQAYAISAARVEIELDIPDDLPPIPLDRAQMQQVLLNLTNNAIHEIRASGIGSHVTIRARLDASGGRAPVARIEIIDDGPGVAPEHRGRLFVPFFTTKQPGEGTGLGLPVSFGIVAAHGGRLSYQPGPNGRGATFLVELPTEVMAATQPADPGPAWEPAAPFEASPLPRRRVLVLDDEPSIRRFLAKALELAGHEAVVASSGAQLLATVEGAQVDAILCDHRMAGMSGTEVYKAVVARRPDLAKRFVFMSGDVLNPDLLSFANAREIGLLAKPFDLDAVGRTVREVIDRATGDDHSRG